MQCTRVLTRPETHAFVQCTGFLTVLRLLQGKVKPMVENRGEMQLDPTPNFDCHVSKNANVDVLATTPLNAYESTQVGMCSGRKKSCDI